MVIEQIKAQLDRLVPVHRVADLSREGPHVAREMALVKVVGNGEERVEALRIADTFRARVVDTTIESFVFELTGATDKLDAFIDLMRPLGLAEVSRTGVAALARGIRTISTVMLRGRNTDHARLLRPRRRREPDQGQEGRHHRLRQPGPRPRQQPEGQRRDARSSVGLRQGSAGVAKAEAAGHEGAWTRPTAPNGPTW